MSVLRLLLKEIHYRWLNSLLSLAAVTAAVALFVALLTLERASERETTRLMRDMGFNLLVLPKGTDMTDFWATDFTDEEMPEEYVQRLAAAPNIAADHYVATLRKKVMWRGRQVLLTGMLPELGAIGKKKKSAMGFQIPTGRAYVGFELAQSLKLKEGDTIDVFGKRLTVEHCLLESGSKEDITVYANLHDVQEMLGKPGRVNTIQALGCICYGERLPVIRRQLSAVLPEAKVTELRSIAEARARIRQMMEEYGAALLLAVLIACAGWVGILSLMNVRDRRQEVGILRALGLSTGQIASLFLGRALLLGVLGAVVGFAVGTTLALEYGRDLFKITHSKITPLFGLLAWSVLFAPVIAGGASFVPAMVAVTQDPARTLVEE